MAGHSKLSPTQRAEYEQAFVEFWEQYHTQVRRWVRRHLRSSKMRRLYDSEDFSQDVWRRFYVALVDGRFVPGREEDALRFLMKLTGRASKTAIQKHLRMRRDIRRQTELPAIDDPAGDTASPHESVQLHEFVEWLLSSLSEHDQQIVKDRISGHGWKELAETDKSPPDALRKRIGRALRRVANDKALDG